MSETEDLFKEVKQIKWHQEAIDRNIELLTRAQKKEILLDIMEFFGNVEGKKKAINIARIYLAVDGIRVVNEIAKSLGISSNNVSRELTKMKQRGYIDIKEVTTKGVVYRKARVDLLLGISKKLERDFGLKRE